MLPSKTENKVYQGEHEPIIDTDTFNRVQKILDARLDTYDPQYKHPFKAKYLLTGLTFCGECGGRVSCTTGHGYSYYGCHKINTADPRTKALPKCKTPNYNTKILDKLIIDEVMKLSYDEKAIKALIKPRKKVDHRKALASLEKQKSRLIDLYAVGGINLDELTIKINTISDKIEQLKNDKPVEPELSFEDAKKIFDNVRTHFTTDLSTDEQRAVLMSLIQKIVLKNDQILIYWRFE
jgi:site-specific DNA recombinase